MSRKRLRKGETLRLSKVSKFFFYSFWSLKRTKLPVWESYVKNNACHNKQFETREAVADYGSSRLILGLHFNAKSSTVAGITH